MSHLRVLNRKVLGYHSFLQRYGSFFKNMCIFSPLFEKRHFNTLSIVIFNFIVKMHGKLGLFGFFGLRKNQTLFFRPLGKNIEILTKFKANFRLLERNINSQIIPIYKA